ncbi:unnamed protein product [Camellia sinensis]
MASNNKKEEPNTAPQPDRWFNLTLGSSFKDHYPSSKFCTLRLTFEGSSEDYKEMMQFCSLMQQQPAAASIKANSQIRKSHITSKFWGKCLNLRKTKLPMGTNRVLSVFPQSVLATDPTSKTTYKKFNLDGNTKLQVVPVDNEPPFFRNCTEQEAHSPWTKNPLKIERVKSMLDPCEDENDDIQDDDVSLGADFVQRDEHSESVSESEL